MDLLYAANEEWCVSRSHFYFLFLVVIVPILALGFGCWSVMCAFERNGPLCA